MSCCYGCCHFATTHFRLRFALFVIIHSFCVAVAFCLCCRRVFACRLPATAAHRTAPRLVAAGVRARCRIVLIKRARARARDTRAFLHTTPAPRSHVTAAAFPVRVRFTYHHVLPTVTHHHYGCCYRRSFRVYRTDYHLAACVYVLPACRLCGVRTRAFLCRRTATFRVRCCHGLLRRVAAPARVLPPGSRVPLRAAHRARAGLPPPPFLLFAPAVRCVAVPVAFGRSGHRRAVRTLRCVATFCGFACRLHGCCCRAHDVAFFAHLPFTTFQVACTRLRARTTFVLQVLARATRSLPVAVRTRRADRVAIDVRACARSPRTFSTYGCARSRTTFCCLFATVAVAAHAATARHAAAAFPLHLLRSPADTCT